MNSDDEERPRSLSPPSDETPLRNHIEIENPPDGFSSEDPQPTAKLLQEKLNLFAKQHGFAVNKSSGRKPKGPNKNDYTRYNLLCDRHGDSRPARGKGIRVSLTRTIGCKSKGVAVRTPEGWIFRNSQVPENRVHNHPPSKHPSTHPQHKKLNDAEKEIIASSSKHEGVRPREIRAMVHDQVENSYINTRTIYNYRAREGRAGDVGYTGAGIIIKRFDDEGVDYRIEWEPDDPNKLRTLVFFHPDMCDYIKRYSATLSIDLTYNTNKYDLPFTHATGRTPFNTTLSLIYGFCHDETEETFIWIFGAIKSLLEKGGAEEPYVIITDQQKELRSAAAVVFPDTQQQICIYHVTSRVLFQARDKWKGKKKDQDKDNNDAEDSQQDDGYTE